MSFCVPLQQTTQNVSNTAHPLSTRPSSLLQKSLFFQLVLSLKKLGSPHPSRLPKQRYSQTKHKCTMNLQFKLSALLLCITHYLGLKRDIPVRLSPLHHVTRIHLPMSNNSSWDPYLRWYSGLLDCSRGTRKRKRSHPLVASIGLARKTPYHSNFPILLSSLDGTGTTFKNRQQLHELIRLIPG